MLARRWNAYAAKGHTSRGADISKIVTATDTEEEELENLRIITLLRRELPIPFLFLCVGSCCQLVHTVGLMHGSAINEIRNNFPIPAETESHRQKEAVKTRTFSQLYL